MLLHIAEFSSLSLNSILLGVFNDCIYFTVILGILRGLVLRTPPHSRIPKSKDVHVSYKCHSICIYPVYILFFKSSLGFSMEYSVNVI